MSLQGRRLGPAVRLGPADASHCLSQSTTCRKEPECLSRARHPRGRAAAPPLEALKGQGVGARCCLGEPSAVCANSVMESHLTPCPVGRPRGRSGGGALTRLCPALRVLGGPSCLSHGGKHLGKCSPHRSASRSGPQTHRFPPFPGSGSPGPSLSRLLWEVVWFGRRCPQGHARCCVLLPCGRRPGAKGSPASDTPGAEAPQLGEQDLQPCLPRPSAAGSVSTLVPPPLLPPAGGPLCLD